MRVSTAGATTGGSADGQAPSVVQVELKMQLYLARGEFFQIYARLSRQINGDRNCSEHGLGHTAASPGGGG